MALTYSFAAGRLVLVSQAFLSVECSTEDGSEKITRKQIRISSENFSVLNLDEMKTLNE